MWVKKPKRTDEDVRGVLVGRKVSTSFVYGGTSAPVERVLDVTSFRALLQRTKKRKATLIQFVAREGGMRTVDVDHIVGIR